MRWLLYNVLFFVAYLAMTPHFLIRMARRGGYRARFADRFGRFPAEIRARLAAMKERPVWIHAVSVGEVGVAAEVMKLLREAHPGLAFVLSTTSSTGWRVAEKQVTPADVLLYCPLDFPWAVRRALEAINPRAFLLTETEIWPNLIRACARRSIPMYLVNARLSDRSAPGYRRLRFWFGPVLRLFTRIFAQSALDRARLLAAGADPERVEVTGSIKFDVARRAPEKERAIAAFLAKYGVSAGSTVLLGGSTWPGEDEALLDIFGGLREAHPELRLVICPRHFEKADAVEANIRKAGLRCVRKSRLAPEDPGDPAADSRAVILADTTGELMGFYGNASIVFVGKSLCEHGAQNMIEPCLCGAATLVGPYTENFRPVMSDLLEAGGVIQVPDAAALGREIARLAGDAAARKALGARASAAVVRRRGVGRALVRKLVF